MTKKITKPLFKKFVKLKIKKFRKLYDLHFVEGYKNNIELLKRDILPEYFLISEIDSLKNTLFQNLKNYFLVTDKELKKIADTKTPQSYIGIYKNKMFEINKLPLQKYSNMLLLDNIQDPKNFGSIIRLAAAFNIDAILLINNSVDVYNPKVVRSSAGLHLSMPIIYLSNMKKIIEIKNKYDFKLICFDLNGQNFKNFKRKIEKKIIVFGNEGHGISEEIKNIADNSFKIEMKNNVESLNIAAVAAICLWELGEKNLIDL